MSKALIALAPENLSFTEIQISNLPLYSADYDADYPEAGTALKKAIEASDGLLFISPEFNRSIPGALKNAIDWGSRPWGTNSFARKPTGLLGASPGAIGTAVMQSSMRSVLSFLDAPQLNSPKVYLQYRPEDFGEDGSISNPDTEKVPGPLHGPVCGVRRARARLNRRGPHRRRRNVDAANSSYAREYSARQTPEAKDCMLSSFQLSGAYPVSPKSLTPAPNITGWIFNASRSMSVRSLAASCPPPHSQMPFPGWALRSRMTSRGSALVNCTASLPSGDDCSRVNTICFRCA